MTDLLRPNIDTLQTGISQTVSHAGVGQYQLGSASACGLAALNCARILFERESSGLHGQELIRDLLSRETTNEILSICPMWTTTAHCEIENLISSVPLFNRYMLLTSTEYYRPSIRHFRQVLTDLLGSATTDSRCAAVVITRPPEIVVCLVVPIVTVNSELFIIFDSHSRPTHPNGAGFIVNRTLNGAARYLNEIFPVDEALLADSSYGWQTQYFANFSGHFLISHERASVQVKDVVEDSSRIILDLQANIEKLKQENRQLTENNTRFIPPGNHTSSRSNGKQPAYRSASPTFGRNGTFNQTSNDSGGPSGSSSRPASIYVRIWNMLPGWGSGSSPDSSDDDDDDGDGDGHDKMKKEPITFYCAVCMDDHDQEEIAFVRCGHAFCRDSLRTHVIYRLEERVFPIYCPLCSTQGVSDDPQVLDELVIQHLGLTPTHALLFEQLQMSKVSIPVNCRGCERTSWIDREDYHRETILFCYFCHERWCKECSQIVPFAGPEHSCDGTKELDRLMKEQKWHYCPGCETPIQKETGCNHMICAAPGCTVHFCWVCGEEIVRSSSHDEISRRMESHFRNCSLFDNIPADRDVPP